MRGRKRLYYCLLRPLALTLMNTIEYINRYVSDEAKPFAQVIVSYGLRSTHLALDPGAEVPDNDDRNVTVFIQIDTSFMPPILIADHNCNDGWVCQDHPDQPHGHNGCYGNGEPCPYPTCERSGSVTEITPDAHNDSEETSESTEAEFLGAGS